VIAGRWSRYALFVGGAAAGLWLLVPVHELLHALGCVASGGTVTELELRPIFGGALLARALPWVKATGEHAGRLAGFSPAGDISYLLTSAANALGWPHARALRGDDLFAAAWQAASLATASAWLVVAATSLLGLAAFAALLVVSGGLSPRNPVEHDR